MKPSHSPLRTNPPNLDRLAKLESWTEQPLREALGEGAQVVADVPEVTDTPPTPAEPVSAPETPVADELDWIPPRKRVAKQSYPLMLPAELHSKIKRLSEKTGESMNAMIVRAAEREYERILTALGKKK